MLKLETRLVPVPYSIKTARDAKGLSIGPRITFTLWTYSPKGAIVQSKEAPLCTVVAFKTVQMRVVRRMLGLFGSEVYPTEFISDLNYKKLELPRRAVVAGLSRDIARMYPAENRRIDCFSLTGPQK